MAVRQSILGDVLALPIDQWLLQYNWGLIAPETELIAAVGLHCCIIFFDMPAG